MIQNMEGDYVTEYPLGIWGGMSVTAIRVEIPSGLEIVLSTLGASIMSVRTPSSSSSVPEEITLNYENLDDIVEKAPYYGATCGRVANRIAKGQFKLPDDPTLYQLSTNNGVNSLHGGTEGWDKKVWTYSYNSSFEKGIEIVFNYISEDGEEGYPGTVSATVTYNITLSNVLTTTFMATTDKPTPINMCNHTYWNLSGSISRPIYDHLLKLNASHYLPVDEVQIPLDVTSVENTPFDFRVAKRIGDEIKQVDGGGEPGYDHCFVHEDTLTSLVGFGESLREIATLEDPVSGRKLIISTTAPGIQLYTGNFLSKSESDLPHCQHYALCLETENFPDAINRETFPKSILSPGEVYEHVITYAFKW